MFSDAPALPESMISVMTRHTALSNRPDEQQLPEDELWCADAIHRQQKSELESTDKELGDITFKKMENVKNTYNFSMKASSSDELTGRVPWFALIR